MGTRFFVYDYFAAHVVFAAGAVQQLSGTLDNIGAQRILLVTTPAGEARYAAMVQDLGARLAAVFSGVESHCPEPVVQQVITLYQKSGADTVVCIGGGSTLGLGKILKAEHRAQFVAVPTTYSGSEMTPIYGRKIEGQKLTRRDWAALPTCVIYDPDLTLDLPQRQTAATGMNSLAHSVEALYPAAPNPVARMLAVEAITLIAHALPRAIANGDDREARSDVLYAAFLGGLLVSMVGVALHHGLGHVLGGLFEIDHGDYNSAVLPHVVAYNAASVDGLSEVITKQFGGSDPGTALSEFATRIGAPVSLSQLGMPAEGIDAACKAILDRAPRNPRPLDPALIAKLITAAHAGTTARVEAFS